MLGHLDRWLAQVFDPEHLDDTLTALLDTANEAEDGEESERARSSQRLRPTSPPVTKNSPTTAPPSTSAPIRPW